MPVTGRENIFDALFRWGEAKSKEEDFYSKSLILVLQRLKRDNQELATDFVNTLFDCKLFEPNTAWDVTGQVGDHNRPDIILKSDNMQAYVEVKWRGSKTREKQLRDYCRELSELIQSGKMKWNRDKPPLFLLTTLGLDKDWKIPYRHVSWMETCLQLGKTKKEFEDLKQGLAHGNLAPEAYYLVRDFYEFLEEKGMRVENVSKMVDRESLLELKKYLVLVKAACLEAQFSVDKPKLEFSDEEDWVGWWFKGRGTQKRNPEDYWCGFYLDDPSRLGFGVNDEVYRSLKNRMRRKRGLEQTLEDEFGWKDYGDNKNECCGEFFFFDLLCEDFLNLPVKRQVKRVSNSISRLLQTAFGGKARTM